MNKKEEMSTERRYQLLNIGLEQFIRFGYYGTSTRRICELAGISSGLFFHYFKTKEALYLELIRLGCDGIRPPVQGDSEPIDYFRAETDRIFRIMTADDVSAKMFLFMNAAILSAAEISKEAGELVRQCDPVVGVVPIIKLGQAKGQIRQGDPSALASIFYGTLRGIAEHHALCPMDALPDPEWVIDLLKNIRY